MDIFERAFRRLQEIRTGKFIPKIWVEDLGHGHMVVKSNFEEDRQEGKIGRPKKRRMRHAFYDLMRNQKPPQ